MLLLYSYPKLFGVADNSGYGLKVYAFMRLAARRRAVATVISDASLPAIRRASISHRDASPTAAEFFWCHP
jgi:hypothetical protein